jgi:hypothetical protein
VPWNPRPKLVSPHLGRKHHDPSANARPCARPRRCGHAAVETHTVTVTNGGLTDFYATLDIPQHNEALEGDIISVGIAITANIDGFFYVENLSASTGGWRINELTWTFTGAMLGGNVLSHGTTVTQPFTALSAYDGLQDYAGTSGAKFPYYENSTANLAWIPGDAGFTSFDGTGTVALDVSTTVWTSHSVFGGSSVSGFSTNSTWTAVVTYTYDPLSVASEVSNWGTVKSLFR